LELILVFDFSAIYIDNDLYAVQHAIPNTRASVDVYIVVVLRSLQYCSLS
jgi:hypothetical protein